MAKGGQGAIGQSGSSGTKKGGKAGSTGTSPAGKRKGLFGRAPEVAPF